MSTSDSDYSIDWLASDEDDYDCPKRLSPQCLESPLTPTSSLATSFRESPSCQRRRCDRHDCQDYSGGFAESAAALQTPTVGPAQGFTSVCKLHTLSVESKQHVIRKRALDRHCEKPLPDTESELFSFKCMELQCYVQPLSSILHSLRSGRYSQRLSSFQEGVAMDRIQRIMGVLQNPNMGGRFLSIILKIEEMLRSWFPHVKPNQTEDIAPAKKQKQDRGGSSMLVPPNTESAASYSSTHLKWLHTSPICALKPPQSMLGPPAPATSPLLARCAPEVTQDNSVSSSTDWPAGSHRHLSAHTLGPTPLSFKISSPCLERLLQAKESIIAPRTVSEGGWML